MKIRFKTFQLHRTKIKFPIRNTSDFTQNESTQSQKSKHTNLHRIPNHTKHPKLDVQTHLIQHPKPKHPSSINLSEINRSKTSPKKIHTHTQMNQQQLPFAGPTSFHSWRRLRKPTSSADNRNAENALTHKSLRQITRSRFVESAIDTRFPRRLRSNAERQQWCMLWWSW